MPVNGTGRRARQGGGGQFPGLTSPINSDAAGPTPVDISTSSPRPPVPRWICALANASNGFVLVTAGSVRCGDPPGRCPPGGGAGPGRAPQPGAADNGAVLSLQSGDQGAHWCCWPGVPLREPVVPRARLSATRATTSWATSAYLAWGHGVTWSRRSAAETG